jgi:hypothetical protein
MISQINIFLLDNHVELFYTVGASALNFLIM